MIYNRVQNDGEADVSTTVIEAPADGLINALDKYLHKGLEISAVDTAVLQYLLEALKKARATNV